MPLRRGPIRGPRLAPHRAQSQDSPVQAQSYLWQIATTASFIAIAACAAPEYSQPSEPYWPFEKTRLGSGVIVAQGSATQVYVRSEPLRPPTAYSWPWAVASQQAQPFHIYQAVRKPTIEPESYSIPPPAEWFQNWPQIQVPGVIPSLASSATVLVKADAAKGSAPQRWPFYSVVQASTPQLFHLLYRPSRVTIEPEAWTQPNLYGLVVMGQGTAQPTQPFSLWQQTTKVTLEQESYRQPATQSWPFGRTQVVSQQPFSIYFKPQKVTIEPESWTQPTLFGLVVMGTATAQPVQAFSFWPGATKGRELASEGYSVPKPQGWPFSLTYTVSAWNWWQIQPREPVPDTSQFYEHRSRDFGADWRLFWITPTNPVTDLILGPIGPLHMQPMSKHIGRIKREPKERIEIYEPTDTIGSLENIPAVAEPLEHGVTLEAKTLPVVKDSTAIQKQLQEEEEVMFILMNLP